MTPDDVIVLKLEQGEELHDNMWDVCRGKQLSHISGVYGWCLLCCCTVNIPTTQKELVSKNLMTSNNSVLTNSAAAHSSNMESPQTSDLLFEWLNDDYLFSPALLLMWCISLLRCLNNRVDISVETTQSSVMIANRSFFCLMGVKSFEASLKLGGSPHTTQWDALKVNPTVVTQFIPFQSVSQFSLWPGVS